MAADLTPKNPAAERPPVARRAARASVPGGSSSAAAPAAEEDGKTSPQWRRERAATGRTYTIALPAGLKLLSLNGREHWAVRHRRSQTIKEAAWAVAKQARIPALERVVVLVEYRPPDRRHRDAENTCIPSAKAAIDGIVQAGVLPDDECPRYVSKIVCTIGEPFPKGMLVLYLIEVVA